MILPNGKHSVIYLLGGQTIMGYVHLLDGHKHYDNEDLEEGDIRVDLPVELFASPDISNSSVTASMISFGTLFGLLPSIASINLKRIQVVHIISTPDDLYDRYKQNIIIGEDPAVEKIVSN